MVITTKYKLGEKIMWTNPRAANISASWKGKIGTVVSVGKEWGFPQMKMDTTNDCFEFSDNQVELAEGPW